MAKQAGEAFSGSLCRAGSRIGALYAMTLRPGRAFGKARCAGFGGASDVWEISIDQLAMSNDQWFMVVFGVDD